MLIFWQECKHILRSRFLWVSAALGLALCIYTAFMSSYYFGDGDISMPYRFTEEHGTSFTKKNAEVYIEYYMANTEEGKRIQQSFKHVGLENVTTEEINAYYSGQPTKLGEKLQEISNGEMSETEEQAYWDIIACMDRLYAPFVIVENNNVEKINIEEWKENWLEGAGKNFPKWKQDIILSGYDHLAKRAKEIVKNKENHQMLPILSSFTQNSHWFQFQFSTTSALGFLWGIALVLAGMAAARSLGGSMMGNMQSVAYTGKKGRKLVLYKLLAVLAVSAALYLAFYLLITLLYLSLFRLDLYWDVSMASMVSYSGSVIPRFPITVGGFWWFQLGVGLGAVLIMTLIFSTVMVLTKSFYAGSAISVGFPLLLLGLVQMVPAAQESLLLMGSPIGLFLNAGKFLQQEFLFSILPHFEGIMLLIWGGIAVILTALGFMRFRKAAL